MAQRTMSWWGIIKQTFSEYSEDKVPRLSAALAYYTIFAIAPLLIIAVAVAGFVFDKNQATQQVHSQLTTLMGEQGADAIQTAMVNANHHGSGVTATIISIVILLIGATGVFGELQDSLNTIWEVKPKPQGFWGILRSRFLSFAMVMGVAFLLLVSLIISTIITAVVSRMGSGLLAQTVNVVVSLVVVTLLFAMIFKVLPDAFVRWRDVWIGAVITAVLFTIGKYLIGLYLARGTVASVFGKAGSLVAVLVWIYYSAQILFIGAEFTQVYARATGNRIEPTEQAERITEDDKAQAGTRPAKKPEEKWYPAVPVNRGMTVAPASHEAYKQGGSKLLPLLAGVALGKVLLGGGKGKKPGRRFVPGKVVEPGFAWRGGHPMGIKDEYTLHVKTPRFVKTAARKIEKGYETAREKVSQYL